MVQAKPKKEKVNNSSETIVRKIEPQQAPGIYWWFSDAWVLIGRSIKHISRSIDQLLGVIIQPIMFMLLFRYIFSGAIPIPGISYVNYLVAGILIQSAAFGSTTTAVGVSSDLQRGIMDRFRSLPMSNSAVLIGHVVADLVRNTISSTVMITVAFLVGFRPEASFLDWVGIIGMLALFTFAISWLSAILGMLAKSPEAVQWISFLLIFPLTFASNAFVPTAGMAAPLKLFAENQPVSHVIATIRALLFNDPVHFPLGNHPWIAIAWCVGAIVVSIPVVSYLFRRQGQS